MKLYAARDKDLSLYIYTGKPIKLITSWSAGTGRSIRIDDELLPQVKFEDEEPTEVTLGIVNPQPKSPDKFDPSTLNPFDKVITKFSRYPWKCDIFSHYVERESKRIDCYCTSEDYVYDKCIPYNDETKHLVGTSEEAPEYYRWWE